MQLFFFASDYKYQLNITIEPFTHQRQTCKKNTNFWCLMTHLSRSVSVYLGYYEHIKNFHFVKKTIDPTSLFEELEVRRGGIICQVAHLVFPVIIFFCLVSFTLHFWHVLSAKSVRLVRNSRIVFEGLLYDCNFLPLQTFRTLFVCQYLCWQIYVNSLNNVENVLWGQVYSGFLVYNVGRLYSCACDELFVRRLVERWLSGGAQVSQNQQSKLPVSSSKYNTQKIYFYLKDICKCVGWK